MKTNESVNSQGDLSTGDRIRNDTPQADDNNADPETGHHKGRSNSDSRSCRRPSCEEYLPGIAVPPPDLDHERSDRSQDRSHIHRGSINGQDNCKRWRRDGSTRWRFRALAIIVGHGETMRVRFMEPFAPVQPSVLAGFRKRGYPPPEPGFSAKLLRSNVLKA